MNRLSSHSIVWECSEHRCERISARFRGQPGTLGHTPRTAGAGCGSRRQVRGLTRTAASAGPSAGASPAALPPPDRSGSRRDRSRR